MGGRKTSSLVAALALIGLGSGAVAVAAPDAGSKAPRCHGKVATIVGTDGDDVLRGTPKRDVIWGGPGEDVILGGLGSDTICGGAGDDRIYGRRGNDLINGGAGTDRVYGGLGDDRLTGGPGEGDDVGGGLGIDTISGGPGDEDLVHGDYGYDRMDGGYGKGDIASFATAVAGGRGSGVWVSLPAHKARGDGRDRLFRFEAIEGSAFADTLIGNKSANVIRGGPGDDRILGGGGADQIDGGQGEDSCKSGGVRLSCGPEAPPGGSALVQINEIAGGGGIQIVGGAGRDSFAIAYAEDGDTFTVRATRRLAVGPGCVLAADPRSVSCATGGPARWLMADLGPGDDFLRVDGSLAGIDFVRIAGGRGDDIIRGGPEDDLIESGPGADRIYGGDGADGLIGGLPGPTFLFGGAGGDLLAAGGGCAGGALVGGPGNDNASFAETQAHPGTLYISLAKGAAWIDAIPGCSRVRLPHSNENIEGSFDNDVLIGDAGPNLLLGQPGEDRFYGGGGDDVIDARDGVRDGAIQCGRKGRPSGHAIIDPFDPPPLYCASDEHGRPIPGLHK